MSTSFNLFDLDENQLRFLAAHYSEFLDVVIAANKTLLTKLAGLEGLPDTAMPELQQFSNFMNAVARKSTTEVEAIVGAGLKGGTPRHLN